MNFSKEVVNAINDYAAAVERENTAFSEAGTKYRNKRITQTVYSELTREHQKKLDTLRTDATNGIRDLLKGYENDLKARYAKRPEMMDSDMLTMLANPLVKLTATDVEDAFERYRKDGNETMMDAVAQYEAEHETGANITHYTFNARMQAANEWVAGVANACKDVNNIHFGMHASGRTIPAALRNE